MTRSEFIENVQCWDDLMEMASEHDCEPLYDIHSKDDLDEVVCNAIREGIHHSYWYDIRDRLSDINIYEDYFRDDGYFDYVNLDDYADFNAYKEEVLEWGDRNDIWDPEEADYVDDDVFVHTHESGIALYWDEVDFTKPLCIDEHLDESIAGNILDLLGGENS